MSDEPDVPPRLPDETAEAWMERINEETGYTPGQADEPRSDVEPYDPEKFEDVRLPYSDD